jgi:hypothetical protein
MGIASKEIVMPELRHWGYDFTCGKEVDAMLAAFNAAGPWRWDPGDSDIYGSYLKCRPQEHVEIRVYARSQFRTGSRWNSGFWAELTSDVAISAEIDRQFRSLLLGVKAGTITET